MKIKLKIALQLLNDFLNFLIRKKETRRLNHETLKFINFIISHLHAGCTLENTFTKCIQSKTQFDPIQTYIAKTLSYSLQCHAFKQALQMTYEEILKNKNYANLALLFNSFQILTVKGSKSIYLLQKVKKKIEDEMNFEHKILVITAQMRFQSNVILFSPLMLSIILLIISPEHIYIFFHSTLGIYSVFIMIFFNILGWIFLRKIVQLENI